MIQQRIKLAIIRFKSIALFTGYCSIILGLSLPLNTGFAAPNAQPSSFIQLTVNPLSQPAIQFEATQAPLKVILNQFAEKTGAVIHFSVLPEEPVTATCAGDTVKQVMECLLGSRVDRVYRKVNDKPAKNILAKNAIQKEEIWILGSRYGQAANNTMACTLDASKTTQAKPIDSMVDESPQDELMRIVQFSGNGVLADLRKEALSMLALAGKTGNPETDAQIVETLQDAFKDQDAEIRAQAVVGLSHQDMDNSEMLHEAIQDKSVDVRLMAVDHTPNDTPDGKMLLREAMRDKDDTVRTKAREKLGAEGEP